MPGVRALRGWRWGSGGGLVRGWRLGVPGEGVEVGEWRWGSGGGLVRGRRCVCGW